MRDMILSLSDPVAQRYAFCRYVLGEPRMEAAYLSGAFQNLGRMTEEEYDVIRDGWHKLSTAASGGSPRA